MQGDSEATASSHKSNDAQGLERKKKVEGHSELCVGRSDETKEIGSLVLLAGKFECSKGTAADRLEEGLHMPATSAHRE